MGDGDKRKIGLIRSSAIDFRPALNSRLARLICAWTCVDAAASRQISKEAIVLDMGSPFLDELIGRYRSYPNYGNSALSAWRGGRSQSFSASPAMVALVWCRWRVVLHGMKGQWFDGLRECGVRIHVLAIAVGLQEEGARVPLLQWEDFVGLQ